MSLLTFWMQWLKSLNQAVKHRAGNISTKIEPELELMQIVAAYRRIARSQSGINTLMFNFGEYRSQSLAMHSLIAVACTFENIAG